MIYLDNSATSFPKPDVVYDFMMDFYKSHGVSPGRSGFDAAIETEEVVDVLESEEDEEEVEDTGNNIFSADTQGKILKWSLQGEDRDPHDPATDPFLP